MRILEIEGLTRRFGGLVAVDAVDAHIDRGEIVGLIGPNGAGKTTIFNLLTSELRPTVGRIRWEGRDLVGLRPEQIAALGVVRTYQHSRVFARLSVLDNVLAGLHLPLTYSPWAAVGRLPAWRRAEAEGRERAEAILEFFGLAEARHVTAGSLSHGDLRKLAVAAKLACAPRLLLLDEPVGGMPPSEAMKFVAYLERIRERGITVWVVEHNMKFVMAVCRRVIVLASGRKLAEGTPAEVQRDPGVIAAYLGTTRHA